MRKLNIWKKGMYAVCGLLMAGVVTLQAGFISMAYPESGVINDTGVNIRSTADSGSTDNVMKRANENMEVSVLGEQTGTDGKTWLKVSYTEGGTERIGYVREDFVTLSTSSQTGNENADEEEQETQDETPAADKNPEGLTPIEGLDDDLTCYFNIDGSHYYINQGFTDSMIPDGFTRTEVEYRGDVIQMVKSNDIDFYLAYLTDYDDQSSSEWAFYDAEAQGFGYYIKLETMQGKYLYLLDTFGAGSMDFGYEKKDLEIDGKLVEAWQLMLEEEEDLTGENDCFYYVYGINQDGNKGLYSYYTKDGTYQRNILTGLEIVDDEYLSTEENTQLLETQIKELRDKYSTDMSKRLTLICVLLVVCVLLLFIVIHLALKLRRAGEEDYEDDEEELPGFRKRQTVSDETNDRTKRHLEKMIMDELDEEPEDELDEEPLPEIMDIQFAEVKDEIYEAPEDFEDDELEEDDFEEEEDEEEYVRPKRRGFFFGRRRDEEDEDDEDDYDEDEEEEEDEDEDEDEDEEEYVRPKRRGFFFGRRRDDEDDYEDDEDEDDFEDDEEYEDDFDDDEHYEDDSDLEDDYEDDEEYEEDYEDDEDDEEEYVKPKRRGFFFGRRRKDDYEEDDYDEEEEEDEDEDEDDYEEERMSWSRSRKAAKEEKARQKEAAKAQREKEKAEASARKSARRSRYEEDDLEEDAATRRANKKTKAADYAEKTVSARKSSRMPEPRFTDDDDDFEFEFIDLDDDF